MLNWINLVAWVMWLGFNISWAAAAEQTTPASNDPHGLTTSENDLAMIEAPRLDWTHAQQAYRLIEKWIRVATVDSVDPASPILASDVSAARVTLRWLGKTVGYGQATIPPATRKGRAIDLRLLARDATVEALESLSQTLIDWRRRASGNVRNQPLNLTDVSARLLVDLQIARHPEPIVIHLSDPPDQIYDSFTPGYHGLIMSPPGQRTIGEESAWLWPASALARNVQPRSQIVQLVNAIDHDVQQLHSVARQGGPSLARFRIIHLVRPDRDMPVTELVRGNVLLPARPVSDRTLEALSQRIAMFLQRRLREDGSMSGTYLPTSDRYHPLNAPDHDVALSAYAWGRRAAYLSSTNADDQLAQGAQDASRRVLKYLSQKMSRDETSFVPASAALLILTMIESPNFSELKAQRDALMDQLLLRRNEDGSFRSTHQSDAKRLDLPTQALIVLALASMYEQTRDARIFSLVTHSQAWLWQQVTAVPLVETLPWLALAEFRSWRIRSDSQTHQTRESKIHALTAEIEAMQMDQITDAAVKPTDMIGGFDLGRRTSQTNGTHPRPSWRTGQFLAFLAAALRHEELTPVDRDRRLLTCGLAARFLGQLMMDQTSAYYVRSMSDTLGGVRLSLWDNRLSVGPAAMALLATTELQETIAQLGR